NNRDASNKETGEYGYEDIVNPLSSTGAPNNVLDSGEDVNANGLLDTYGGTPSYNGARAQVPPGAPTGSPYSTSSTPTTVLGQSMARTTRPIFFRRALKLINGATIAGTSGISGLTVVAENPVYVQGNWNANGAFNDPHAAISIIADAVTILSSNWNDITSLED